MAVVNDIQLKQYFETGDFPTQQQFFDLIDSKLNVNDIPLLPTSNLTIGTTPIYAGYDGGILFQDSSVLTQSANFFWDNANSRLGIKNQAPSSVFQINSSSGNTDALSLSITFKRTEFVYNSNTTWASFRAFNNSDQQIGQWGLFQEVAGGGSRFSISLSTDTFSNVATEKLRINSTGFLSLGTSFKNGALLDLHAVGSLSTDKALRIRNYADTRDMFEVLGDSSFAQYSGSTPSSSVTFGYLQYSRDANGVNTASPHFLTEDGKTIKLYQYTTGIASATLVNGAGGNARHDDTYDGYTVAQVVKALRNLGILA